MKELLLICVCIAVPIGAMECCPMFRQLMDIRRQDEIVKTKSSAEASPATRIIPLPVVEPELTQVASPQFSQTATP